MAVSIHVVVHVGFGDEEAVRTEDFSYSVNILRGRRMVHNTPDVLVNALVAHVRLTTGGTGLHEAAHHFLQLLII